MYITSNRSLSAAEDMAFFFNPMKLIFLVTKKGSY